MTAQNTDANALGEPLIGVVRLPDAMSVRNTFRQGLAGNTLNAAVAAARHGARAGYLTALGGDRFG